MTRTVPRSLRAQRFVAGFALFSLALASLTACTFGGASNSTPTPDPGVAVVGAEGFTVDAGEVIVSAAGEVAPEGTSIDVATSQASLPAQAEGFAETVGSRVDVSLDGGSLQPASPITLEFRIDPGPSSGDFAVLAEDQTTGSGMALLESTWDESRGVLTATTEHLSWFMPVLVDAKRFTDSILEQMTLALGLETSAPGCFDAPSELDVSIVGDGDQVAWPCATATSSGVAWSLQSNSPLVWQVLTKPVADFEPQGSLKASGVLTLLAANRLIDVEAIKGDAVVIPGGTLKGTMSGSAPFQIDLDVEPGLSQVATIALGLGLFVPEAVMKRIDGTACFADILERVTTPPSAAFLSTILSCFAGLVGGKVGSLLSIVTSAPSLFLAQLQGIVREVSGTSTVQFWIAASNANQVKTLPDTAAWLYEQPMSGSSVTQGRDAANVVTGGATVVFENSTNIWVSCSPSTSYVTTFDLAEAWSTLDYALALQQGAPDDLQAKFTIKLDGATAAVHDAIRGELVPRTQLDVTGVREMTVETTSTGECGSSAKGYGALLDAHLL